MGFMLLMIGKSRCSALESGGAAVLSRDHPPRRPPQSFLSRELRQRRAKGLWNLSKHEIGFWYIEFPTPIDALLDFPDAHLAVKQGCRFPPSFMLLSFSPRSRVENVACLLPTGQLIIAVDKDTYQELGLQAKHSSFPRRYTAFFRGACALVMNFQYD